MIKGIILDVDGVIVGEKIGYNSPYPHTAVTARLKSIEAGGISISLCTAKPHFSIGQIIKDAGLHSLHITDGGAVIIDPLDNIILKSHVIDKIEAKQVVEAYLSAGVYVEVYTVSEYVINAGQQSALTENHTHILQCPPRLSDELLQDIGSLDVTKIMPIANDEADKSRLEAIFEPFKDKLTLSWGIHPIALPRQFGIITAKGISKAQAALEIAEHSGIRPGELLGIGDSTSDWQFIEHCGYAATVANGTKELKDLVAGKGERGFVGGSVDNNGVLAIFDYFKL
jgi:hydroxymethylpyrimidine pyrophosphatase-like HAD family hydrolase